MSRLTICKIFTLLAVCILPIAGYAQDSRGFAYQGYARNAEGVALVNVAVSVRFTISTSYAPVHYQETHTVRTDEFGLYQATLGTRNPTDFAKIAFHPFSSYTLRTEVGLAGGPLVEVSNGPMNWVPYASTARNGVAVGTILPFGGPKANIPPGYLPCDGATYNRTQYPALYAAIGGAWGESGAQFRVPDLRGVFLRGQNDGRSDGFRDANSNSRESVAGGASGDNVGSFQKDQFSSHSHTPTVGTSGAHSHTWSYAWSSSEGDDGSIAILLDDGNQGSFTFGTTNSTGRHNHEVTINNNAGLEETRPKNAYVYYIIKH